MKKIDNIRSQMNEIFEKMDKLHNELDILHAEADRLMRGLSEKEMTASENIEAKFR